LQKNKQQAFEFGCFPGRFLVEIGQKDYILNGCDLTPRIEKDFKAWLQENNCKVEELVQVSYTEFTSKSYDLVASFGFIEHFKDCEKIFKQHCQMVKVGGTMIVQYPNFQGWVQNKLHSFFDRDNLNNHVVESMDLDFYRQSLPENFEIVCCSYYGNFDFWVDDFKHRNGKMKKLLILLLKILVKVKIVWRLLPNNKVYSPYAVLIAKRKY